MFKAKVHITLKNGVLDPQGKAVKDSLTSLGYAEVDNVRIGKYIEIELNTNDYNAAMKKVEEICKKLLANVVIEDYQFLIEEVIV